MSARYWVGGTATWDATAGSKWATTSGGAGGASIPTSSDDVYFDANSGSGTVSWGASGMAARNVDFTGFAGTVQSFASSLSLQGNLTFGSGMNNYASFTCAGTGVITTNGVGCGSINVSGNYTVVGNITVSFSLTTSSSASLDLSNKTIVARALNVSNTSSQNWTNAHITLTGAAGNILNIASGASINSANSVLDVYPTGSGGSSITLVGGGKHFGRTTIDRGDTTGTLTITGNNTFDSLKYRANYNHDLHFAASSTQTILGEVDIAGKSGAVIDLDTSTGSGIFTLSKPSGIVDSDYLNITRSTVTGNADWYAGANSVDNGSNTDWIFADAPYQSKSNFLALF